MWFLLVNIILFVTIFMIVTLVLQKFYYTYTLTCFMSLHDFESFCHFYFGNSWNVSIFMKLRHRFFLNAMNKICTIYYEDVPLYIESAGNGSCHWVYMYVHVLLIKREWVLMYWRHSVNTSRPQSEISL